MTKKIIAVFTGNRAEYGLQYPILKAIDAHPDLEYRLIVSGAHLDDNFGRTLDEIRADGFDIHETVDIKVPDDTLRATAYAIGSGVIAIAEALARVNPDIFVVYADRFEGFAAVIAGSQTNVPVAHIEGGDLTEGGALDDSVRHAMSKLAHLHFTTNQQASNRVIGMGEEPWRVHTVGFPMIDMILDGNFASREDVLAQYKLDPTRPIIVFTQHSVTTLFDAAEDQLRPSLEGLAKFSREFKAQVILTYPNNDAGGRHIYSMLEDVMQDAPEGFQLHRSLGRYNYHGLLALAQTPEINVVCAGNSSSGIKESPAFGCPCVNIGTRQLGRLRAENVLDAPYEKEAIFEALKTAALDPAFRKKSRESANPYGMGDAGIKIAKILAETELGEGLIIKKMLLKGEVNEGWHR
ncbi:MAG: UDP-N-acetylglucosamine 2-epimerase (hydrolyzing) [Alphaproteobacteria bacterium]|nr:UDP-N-acetylglucosamine 2-epimerase (hydrolyzing) [Alphaproteobacteria bacterium]